MKRAKRQVPPMYSFTTFYDHGRPKLRLDFPIGVAHQVQVTIWQFDGTISTVEQLPLSTLDSILTKAFKR
jgi:hypothetical protein